jgi:hypothetical protein
MLSLFLKSKKIIIIIIITIVSYGNLIAHFNICIYISIKTVCLYIYVYKTECLHNDISIVNHIHVQLRVFTSTFLNF